MKDIYLDYAATTPIDDEVLNSYMQAEKHFFANTTSLHKLGQESNYMYNMAIEEIKKILNIPHHRLIFTSCATEANNLGILGFLKNYKSGKIITTKMEHASVYEVIKSVEKDYEVVYLDVLENGLVDLDMLERNLDNKTILVSIMWVNNILGTVQNIKRVIELVKAFPKAKLHVDIVQGFCKLIPNFNFNDIDMLTFSTHKIYGPKGVGALLVKDGIDIKKIMYGSTSQYNLRPGTFSVALVVATAKAIKKYYPLINKHYEYVKNLYINLYQGIKDIPGLIVNTPAENISYYILNLSMNMKGETLLHILEAKGIYVSTGSACSSRISKPEKTVLAMTKDEARSLNSIRISLSPFTTLEDISYVIKVFKELR